MLDEASNLYFFLMLYKHEVYKVTNCRHGIIIVCVYVVALCKSQINATHVNLQTHPISRFWSLSLFPPLAFQPLLFPTLIGLFGNHVIQVLIMLPLSTNTLLSA